VSPVTLTRPLTIPDPRRLARCLRAPDLGPRVLFFSGGSALKPLSQQLIRYTHQSIHLITPFDSGGSSAALREAFQMLSVGDLRNRLMALADQSVTGNPAVYELFALRLPEDAPQAELRAGLERLAAARDPLVLRIPNPLRRLIRNHLLEFLERMGDFDLRGASIGNLILAAGYLMNRRHIEPVMFLFSKLVEVRGVVKPTTGLSYHLAARLQGGRIVVGQHRFTGKHHAPLRRRIRDLWLTRSLESAERVEIAVKPKIRELIASADLICYPFGSFWSSLVANLLPTGIGEAVRRNPVPKVYIPNPVGDPEQAGMGLFDSVQTLVRVLRAGAEADAPAADLLGFVLVDTRGARYPAPLGWRQLRDQGIQVIDTPLVSDASRPHLDPQLVLDALISMT